MPITELDGKDPRALVRYIRQMEAHIAKLEQQFKQLELSRSPIVQAAGGLSADQLQAALKATGSHPLNVENLRGLLADPQTAGIKQFTATPTGRELDEMAPGQLFRVTSGGVDTLWVVLDTNPHTSSQIATTPSNMMTLDTIQTVTALKTFTSGLNITGGQFDSTTQYALYANRTATQAINNTTPTELIPNFEQQDVGNIYDTTTGRLTVPAGGAGTWLIGGQVQWAAAAGTYRTLELYASSSILLARDRRAPVAALATVQSVVAAVPAVAGDYFSLWGTQDSGGALNAENGIGTTMIWGYKLC